MITRTLVLILDDSGLCPIVDFLRELLATVYGQTAAVSHDKDHTDFEQKKRGGAHMLFLKPILLDGDRRQGTSPEAFNLYFMEWAHKALPDVKSPFSSNATEQIGGLQIRTRISK